jgi:hypothetical protein
MLKFLIIAAWITPGILLFLYLLWIGKRFNKRRKVERVQLELPLIQPGSCNTSKSDPQEIDSSQPSAATRDG